MTQQQADYIIEAMELLEGTSIEISEPQKIVERRGGKLIESDRPAFVKMYTDFKRELKTIDGDALKVWLYLALSVNRYTKDARPGLRKIAEETGLAINTVRGAIERLERDYHLLDVEKEEGKSSKYHPSDYISVAKETVSNGDTVTQTVSKKEGTVSNLSGTVSSTRKDFAQLEELESTRKDVLDGIIHYQLKPKGIRDAFAKYFRLTPNWEAKYNSQFLEWLVRVDATPEQIERAADLWSMDKRFNWAVPTLKGIQEHWIELTSTPIEERSSIHAL